MFDNLTVSYTTILLAAIAAFVFGFIWHMIFKKTYSKLNKQNSSSNKKDRGMAVGLLFTFIGLLITSFILAFFMILIYASSMADAVEIAFMGWLGFLASTTLLNDLAWKKSSITQSILNGIYWLGAMILMALVIYYLG